MLKPIAFLKKTGLGAAFGILLGLFAFGPAAEAANLWELNFWLSGPKYEGRVAPCEAALGTITSQFRKREQLLEFALQITGYAGSMRSRSGPGSRTIFRAAIARRRHAERRRPRTVYYSVIEDGGFASFGSGVEWCVVGLDRNWAYNPACKAARP